MKQKAPHLPMEHPSGKQVQTSQQDITLAALTRREVASGKYRIPERTDMTYEFDLSRLDMLLGKRVEIVRHDTQGGQKGMILDVSTAIPVRLRQMLMDEKHIMGELKSEYGHRVHIKVQLDHGEEILVTWKDVQIID